MTIHSLLYNQNDQIITKIKGDEEHSAMLLSPAILLATAVEDDIRLNAGCTTDVSSLVYAERSIAEVNGATNCTTSTRYIYHLVVLIDFQPPKNK